MNNPVRELATFLTTAYRAKTEEFRHVAQMTQSEEDEIIADTIEQLLDNEQRAGRILIIGTRDAEAPPT